jgi:transcriptional regulator with XRE-family HTH domain
MYMPPGSPEYERFIRFKKNLLYWEAKRGKSRQQLLDHMGVDVNHFDRALKMTPEDKIAYLEKMAAFLSIPLTALFAPPPLKYPSLRCTHENRE